MYRNNRMEKMAEIEKVIFMNMCMVYDHAGRVLALDKVGKSYSGTTFPGGHVEPGETFTESVIREIYDHKQSKAHRNISLDDRSCEKCRISVQDG